MPELKNCQQDPEDQQQTRDLEIIRAHAIQLSEQFDSVQIICTRDNGPKNSTIHAAHGSGNWYARYGSVDAWMKAENNRMGRE